MFKKIPFILLIILFGIAIFGPLVSSYSPREIHLEQKLEKPSATHFLGTDENGRDILSRLLHGARISLLIGGVVMGLCLCIGVLLGFFAGFFGGWVDRVFLGVADILQAFPGMLLVLALAAFLPAPKEGNGLWVGIQNLVLVLTLVGWVGYARTTRAQVLSLREKDFIMAALSLGVRLPRLFFKYILPNIAGPLLVQASFGLAGVILIESTLSFLGLGLPLDTPSFGRMLDSGSSLLLVAPYLSIFPGLAIMVSVLTFNLVGDQLRDHFSRR